jgi:ribosomal protein S18 acetylase RimI-like enzyme
MPLVWTDSLDAVDWDELSELYRIAPLARKEAAKLKTVFTNSMFRRFAFDDGKLVAAGRVLADGVDCAYLCDVAIHPSYQGQGLGREIVATLVELARGHKKIILYSVPGKEGFYARLGFRRMTTAMAIFEDQALAVERGYLIET